MQLPSIGNTQHIQLKFAFGINTNIKNNLYFLDEEKIIYPAGYNIVQYNIQDKTQVYYQGLTDYRGISCIELSPLRRWLAVGLKGAKFDNEKFDNPSIAIYDTITQRKKHILNFKEVKIKYWVSLAFPSSQQEAKHLVSLSGNCLSERHKDKESKDRDSKEKQSSAQQGSDKIEGEIIACYWNLSGSGKILAWVQVSLANIDAFEISINKNDTSFFSCIGRKVFKCFKKIDSVEEGDRQADDKQKGEKQKGEKYKATLKNHCTQLNGAPQELSQDYTCHTWLTCDNNLIVCTANGEIIVCNENAEFIEVLKQSPVFINKQSWRIECINTYSKGFIVGAKDSSIYVYRATNDDKNRYEEVNRVLFKQYSDLKDLYVTGLSITPHSEDKIACSLSNNQIYSIKLKRDSIYSSDSDEQIEQVSLAFHSGPINGMDICIRKPLIATCGKDKTIKVWNYEEKTLELSWLFNEEAYCIALHPSGLHMIVCLNDKLRWMNICLHQSSNSNKSKHYKEITQFKQCKEVRFSNGGHYFAAIDGTQSSQLIKVFRFYTGEQPPSLVFKGHTGRVKSLAWSKDDSLLASCGVDGMVYIWRIDNDSGDLRLYENSHKSIQLSCVALNMDTQMIYSCGSDRFLHQGFIFDSSQQARKINQEVQLNQIAFTSTNKIMFAGIADEQRSSGAVRCILFTTPTNNKFYDYPAHDEQGIEKLRITYDDKYLITAGRDGCIMLFEIKDKDARGMRLKEGYPKNAEEILVTRQDLDDLKNTIDNYQSLIGEFNNQTLNNQTNQKDEQIKQLQERLQKSLEHNKTAYEQLQEKKRDIEKKYDEELKIMKEKFEAEIQELDTSYQRKVMDEVEKHESVKKVHEIQRNKNNRERQQKAMQCQMQAQSLDQEYQQKLHEERSQRERVQNDIDKMQKDNDEIYRQIEQETKEEIENLNNKNLEHEAEVKERHKKAKSDAAITTKKIDQKKKDSEQYEEQFRLHQKQLKKLREENETLLKEIQQQKEIIQERDKTIGKQEKQIYKQKKKSQNLEKFKFVLDHKIKELKRDIGPREDEIARMKEETNQMDQLLKKYNSYNNHLGNAVDELYTAQELMNSEIKNQRTVISSTNNKIKRFKDDLYKAVQHIQDYEKLQQHVNELKRLYANKNIERNKNDEQILQEYENQKAHLQYKVQRLKKYLKQDNQIHKDYNLGLMSNNVNLIKEINILRKQIKDIQKGEGGQTGKPAEHARSLTTSFKRARTAGVRSNSKNGNRPDEIDEALNDPAIQQKQQILVMQSDDITQLRVQLEELHEENRALTVSNNF
ncbi:WD40 domain protein (macronuclear) [Tetrahymena thermophila SB210]|uniref:WD40 domain protein n=1 Tax=Tetrahymena thermophila (strain SB210) TaxID=312017 RepID=Q24CI8_TETTS|nr:WD40 domain protein [Tetrahymena thermophila SB210]EAS05472.2 WD40 domain protein [Tetrahymena thermophila SB210]|eukprot:XP_001025717.2 WD40 domain protein [Tetrahymena thermophila SB210]